MSREIEVIGIRRPQPEIRLYVLALIALARQLQDEEEQAEAAGAPGDQPTEAGDD